MKIKIIFYLKNGLKITTREIGLEDICEKNDKDKYVYMLDDGKEIVFETISDLIDVFTSMIDNAIKSNNKGETISFGTEVVVASEVSAYKFKVIEDKTPAPENLVTVEYQ